MCKTRLKPRWITILTGVAICALVCVYSTSSSWAAMCMVGYNSTACSGNSGVPVPPTSNNVGPDGPNPPIETDCERLGYSARGAKPNSNLWPKIALKNGENNTAKWICDVCQQNGTAVRDKSGFARYNCYLKCQYEDEDKDKDEDKPTNKPTNIEGGTGPIVGWKGVYRDQFVRSQADCNKLFGTKTGVNGNLVPAKKFYWITRNVCGQCIKQPCDGAAIKKGCYDVCNNKYTLENGTQCCNKLDKLVSLNPDYGDPNYWYPRTSPLYHESGCYTTTTHATAYGDFNNLSDSHPDALCYHQVKMTCPDSCDEPKEDNDCTCGPKSCETLAEETGQTYSANTDNIVENTVIYHFDNGEVEKVNGICFQKTPVSGCTSTGCYTLSKLTCPNGEPDSDCNCGVGCPSGSIPEDDYKNNRAYSAYINGKVIKDAEGKDKEYCIELSSDGSTCATWSKCYTYNQCSELALELDSKSVTGILVPDGAGGCMCGGTDEGGRPWKTGPDKCDIDNGKPVHEAKFSPPEGNIYNHYGTEIPAIVCKTYNGVTCEDVSTDEIASKVPLVGPRDGPDGQECMCFCSGEYTTTYFPSITREEVIANKPECAIIKEPLNIKWPKYNNKGGSTSEITCVKWDTVVCPDRTSLNSSSCECECDSGTQINGSEEKPENADGKVYSYSVDHQTWTSTDGSSQTISCYDEGTKDCGDKLLIGNDCVDCDYLTAHDSDFEGSWTEGAPNSCACGQTEWSKTYTSNGKSKTCTKCENNTTDQTCEGADKIPADATLPYPNGDNDWWCELQNVTTCVAWKDGAEITCKEGKTAQSSMSLGPCPNDGRGYHNDECLSSEIKIERCLHRCQERWKCVSYECPRFTSTTCSGEGKEFALSKVSTCIDAGQGFCIIDGQYCKTSTEASDGECQDKRDDE